MSRLFQIHFKLLFESAVLFRPCYLFSVLSAPASDRFPYMVFKLCHKNEELHTAGLVFSLTHRVHISPQKTTEISFKLRLRVFWYAGTSQKVGISLLKVLSFFCYLLKNMKVIYFCRYITHKVKYFNPLFLVILMIVDCRQQKQLRKLEY